MNGHEMKDVCCDECRLNTFMLVEHLIYDLQHLASEVVRLRHMLSLHLPKSLGETIRSESLSDLHGSYYDYAAYIKYVNEYCDGNDPMECDRYNNHMIKLSKGKESSEFRSLTF